MLIFAEKITSRIEYAFAYIFGERGISYAFTTDVSQFTQDLGPKLNYSHRTFADAKTICPSKLLFEEKIEVQNLSKGWFNEMEVIEFSGVSDPVSSLFYVLTRYEEYTETKRDKHDRFESKNSIQSTHNWLQIPICDVWSEGIVSFLGLHSNQGSPFAILPTFDIDSTYAYKGKGFIRQSFGMVKELLNGDISRLTNRINTLFRFRKDPFDTFEKIQRIAKQYPKTRCFWLMADYGKWDKNLPYTNSPQKRVIQTMAENCGVGIHPGHSTYLNDMPFQKEKSRLEVILDTKITESRQHYLRLKMPETYQILNSQGIQMDYTMGYAESCGFRAGTARPFPWFNLSVNHPSNLILQPFCYMDGTLNEYMKLTPAEALLKVKELKSLVTKYGGNFCFIWHNETIGFRHHWKGWEMVLESSL